MNRRRFLGLGLGVLAATILPSNLSAIDFRETKPKAWNSSKVDDAIFELYGKNNTISKKVKLTTPTTAENGAMIDIGVSTKLDAKTVSLYQDANPQSLLAVFTVQENAIVDYTIRIKMQGSGNITAVVEHRDGNLYRASKFIDVTNSGCVN